MSNVATSIASEPRASPLMRRKRHGGSSRQPGVGMNGSVRRTCTRSIGSVMQKPSATTCAVRQSCARNRASTCRAAASCAGPEGQPPTAPPPGAGSVRPRAHSTAAHTCRSAPFTRLTSRPPSAIRSSGRGPFDGERKDELLGALKADADAEAESAGL